MRLAVRAACVTAIGWAGAAVAHHPDLVDAADAGWNLEPWLVVSIAFAATLYALGVARLWRKAGAGRGIRAWQPVSFAIGWIGLVVALVSPFDRIAASQFWLHMVQHEVLMVIAAPLLVLSRPLEAMTWALPPGWRAALGRALHAPAYAAPWRIVTLPARPGCCTRSPCGAGTCRCCSSGRCTTRAFMCCSTRASS
jgi:putative membrane protein